MIGCSEELMVQSDVDFKLQLSVSSTSASVQQMKFSRSLKFRRKEVRVLQWSSPSPDLNPVEMLQEDLESRSRPEPRSNAA